MIRSSDGGKSWQALNTVTEVVSELAASVVLDPEKPDNVFVGTRTAKLLRSTDGSGSWTSLGVKVRNVADMKAVHV